jgi:lipopolysaccharide transport system ATP-binding protein
MADVAIRVEGLSKQYRLGEWGTRFGAVREQLAAGFRRRGSFETIWALDDVSFEIEPGEAVGVIGRNGAGKTTLLKILSRITRPTRGYAEFRGRVGTLLEVGTGFHPELTGRDNIFLNGAILGMRRAEIERKFDDIVAFSGVERFIDTPVKRYSSGMYVRLAFSVAAHLEPEILLVDEVLAVGDFEFQRKCLGKMQDVAQSGRTVLFVSHNMSAVSRLCDRAILLAEGRLVLDGPTPQVVGVYLTSDLGTSAQREWAIAQAPGDEHARLLRVRAVNRAGKTVETIDARETVGVEIVFEVLREEQPIRPQIMVTTEHGIHAFNAMDTSERWNGPAPRGRYTSTAWIPGNLLNEGRMTVGVFLSTLSSMKTVQHAVEQDAIAFHVVDPVEGDSAKGFWTGQWAGGVRPLLDWTVEHEELEEPLERPSLVER